MPLVSAAIITHNRARFLDDAISSVLAQTVDDIELIVIDDGSTDDTEELVGRYSDRVRYIRREHRGKAAARNAAVRLARSDLIAFCDSDDSWYPDRLERQLAALADAPGVGMVHGHIAVTDEYGRALPDRTAETCEICSAAHRKGATYASYALENRCFSSTILVRREVFDTVGMYDPALPIEDYDFYLRLLLAYDILFLEGAPLASYRAHGDKTTSDVLGAGQILTAEKHLAFLARRDDVPDARRARQNFHLMIARTWRALGDRRKARAAALRALLLGAPRAIRFTL